MRTAKLGTREARPVAPAHVSVLLEELVTAIDPTRGQRFVDATVGLGGHAEALIRRASPEARLVALDRDPRALEIAKKRLADFEGRVIFANAVFGDLSRVLEPLSFLPVDGGVIADLGVSSLQLDEASRGFSFQHAGPLDMRMGEGASLTAAELIDQLDLDGLSSLLVELGEVQRARAIARAILEARHEGRLDTTEDLAKVVERASGKRIGKIHPATLVFQALRIAVNQELEQLDRFLASLAAITAPGARIAIISFHSLEDRRVKRFLHGQPVPPSPRGMPLATPKAGPFRPLTSKPITPSAAEIARNPRARSAKLRVGERREE